MATSTTLLDNSYIVMSVTSETHVKLCQQKTVIYVQILITLSKNTDNIGQRHDITRDQKTQDMGHVQSLMTVIQIF